MTSGSIPSPIGRIHFDTVGGRTTAYVPTKQKGATKEAATKEAATRPSVDVTTAAKSKGAKPAASVEFASAPPPLTTGDDPQSKAKATTPAKPKRKAVEALRAKGVPLRTSKRAKREPTVQ
uniref:Uncharacterized protein n=1 Tax=Haptolina ericina TaxID=156174 RepID=A0A7S3EXC1_9EUKA|mmetsp:Transcript_29261/g.66221  ORF Transcript_29261/g.66221 Transcript_29261/m.66221 type:complete len:121 (+) Transcript_29261:42-404(+)